MQGRRSDDCPFCYCVYTYKDVGLTISFFILSGCYLKAFIHSRIRIKRSLLIEHLDHTKLNTQVAVCFRWLSLPDDFRVTDEALLAETT